MSDDREVRLFIYRRFIDGGSPPSVSETAEALGIDVEEASSSYRRLADAKTIVLEPGTLDVWMANPLSARPTPFRVEAAGRGRWWGNCVWDALGVAAMLDADAVVSTECPDCAAPLTLAVRSGRLEPVEAVGHFAVPAAKWWEDIGFT